MRIRCVSFWELSPSTALEGRGKSRSSSQGRGGVKSTPAPSLTSSSVEHFTGIEGVQGSIPWLGFTLEIR